MSGTCQRFEHEGLEVLARGEPLGDHVAQCPDCQAAAAAYRQVAAKLEAVPRQSPPPDFEAKVWARIARKDRRRRSLFAIPAFAVAVAAAVTLMVWPGAAKTPSLSLSVQDAQTEAVRGSASPKPGDVLLVRAGMPGELYSELRVYRDGSLVLRCVGGPTCTRTEDVLEAKVRLNAIGHYEAVLLYGEAPVTGLGDTGTLAEDVDRAINGGAEVVTAAPVDVY